MHTATQFDSDSFECTADGRAVPVSAALPSWNPSDRFGIVVASPLGVLGASLLVQAAIAAFYSARPQRRDEEPVYPEVYAFHLGSPMGDHSAFDFWPPRKEVVVALDPLDVLASVNAHAITRLALPAGPPGDLARLERGPSTWAEQQSARDRVTSCFLYDACGAVPDADLTLSSTDPRVEENATYTFDAVASARAALEARRMPPDGPSGPGPSTGVDTARWAEQVRARAHEVSDARRQQLRRERAEAADPPAVRVELYRRLTIDDAIARIAGLC